MVRKTFSAEDFKTLNDEFKEAIKEAGDASIDTLLKDHEDADKNLEALKSSLEKIVEKKPIIFFIDELDRCRPTFAVNMLETIKHIFDVTGVRLEIRIRLQLVI